jgi:glutamyl-tRNA reductase
VLSAELAGEAIRARRGLPLLLVDLAVPRDVDPALGRLDGCYLYDIDDLEAVVEQSLAGRRGEAARRRAARRGGGRPLPRLAGLARRRPGDRVPARAGRGDRAAELAKAEGRLGRLSEADRTLSRR